MNKLDDMGRLSGPRKESTLIEDSDNSWTGKLKLSSELQESVLGDGANMRAEDALLLSINAGTFS